MNLAIRKSDEETLVIVQRYAGHTLEELNALGFAGVGVSLLSLHEAGHVFVLDETEPLAFGRWYPNN